MSSPEVSGKCFCLITGASSGFGQAVAQLLVKKSGLLEKATAGSKILLLSRNNAKMETTKSLMLQNGCAMDRFEVEQVSLDLSNAMDTQNTVSEILGKLDKGYDYVFIFSNAGSVGDVSKSCLEYDWCISDYQGYFNVNVVSPIYIVTQFCQHFVNTNCIVIQVSSLAAVQPLPYIHVYCSAKAALDMFMKCLTLDNAKVKTLNYAPGPMDTDMGKELQKNSGAESTRKAYQEMFDNGTIVKPVDSANKLFAIIQGNKFTSGDHVDYFD